MNFMVPLILLWNCTICNTYTIVTCSISCQQIVETNGEWRHYLMEVNSTKLYFIGDYGPKPLYWMRAKSY